MKLTDYNEHGAHIYRTLLARIKADPSLEKPATNWYACARDALQSWADDYGFTLETVAGVVAALSPQLSWKYNLALAERVLLGKHSTGGAFQANIDKALVIACGCDPLEVLRGLKVRDFYRSLVNPDHGSPCIDRHILAAYYMPGDTVWATLTPRRYALVQAAIIAAHDLWCHNQYPVSLIEFQALVWCYQRGALK